MREPRFWRKNGLRARLLTPLAMVYGTITDTRMNRNGKRADVPVFCVGNLTLGGAGKTPTAIAVARLLLEYGEHPFFLTRGHGGTLKGPLTVQQGHTAEQVGDETLLLDAIAPTIVARDRVSGAAVAVKAGASVIVMDDGFQNPSLEKDFSLLVIDGERAQGNGRVFPAGPLRASLLAQLRNADAVLFVGHMGPDAHALKVRAQSRSMPVLYGRLTAEPSMASRLQGRKVLAFSGIGYPEKFFSTLETCGISVRQARSFADHHRFTKKEADELLEIAAQEKLVLVTTEKDMARMRDDANLSRLTEYTSVLPVRMTFDDENTVRREVIERFLAMSRAQ
jgi:tetraacyldisaccharide 4'-kinase